MCIVRSNVPLTNFICEIIYACIVIWLDIVSKKVLVIQMAFKIIYSALVVFISWALIWIDPWSVSLLMYLYCWKKSVWFKERSKFRTFSKNLRIITSKCICASLAQLRLKLRMYSSSRPQFGSVPEPEIFIFIPALLARLVPGDSGWARENKQSPPWEKIILVLGWLHHFLTFCAALYNSVSALLGRNTVSLGCLYKF